MIKKYREEIDGLRGLAVLGVIFYHAEILINNKNIFSGGFLGVDIFLVVSVFLLQELLIMNICMKKLLHLKIFMKEE